MSRYNNIDTITFTDKDGIEYPVKDLRPISEFETGVVIKPEKDLLVDDLVSRREYYGDNAEDISYVIVDHNVEKFVENDFEISKVKDLRIPIIQES